MNKLAITSLAALLIACSSQAEKTGPYPGALGRFIDGAASQISMATEVKRLCPNAKIDPDLHAFLKEDSDFKSSSQMLRALDESIASAKPVADTLAPKLIKKAGGCTGPKFAELEDLISEQNASLMMHWLQKSL